MTDLRITDLEQLIARLEAASVGSLELSAEIERDIVGHMVHEWPFWFRATSFDDIENSAVVPGIPYTESLDAAVTLRPEGCSSWELDWNGHSGALQGKPYCATVYLGGSSKQHDGHAATPSLAYCIAAFKARLA